MQRTESSYLGEKGEGRGRVEIHSGRGQKTLKAHSLNPTRTHGRPLCPSLGRPEGEDLGGMGSS